MDEKPRQECWSRSVVLAGSLTPARQGEQRAASHGGAHRHSLTGAVCASAPLHSPLAHSWAHDIYQLLPQGLTQDAGTRGGGILPL